MRLISWMLMVLLAAGAPLYAQDVTAQDSVYDYITDNPDQVGIVCYALDAPEAGVYHNADARFPLASTMKILLLVGYAEQVAAGAWDADEQVSLAELDRYYLPGTDGGAYEAWLDALEATESVSLAEIADGMIRFSTNAGADYLLDRLIAVDYDWDDLFARLGVENSDVPESILGLFLTLENPETGLVNPDNLTDADFAETSAALAARYLDAPAFRDRVRGRAGSPFSALVQPAYFDRFGSFGTPRDYARVMQAILIGDGLTEDAAQIARDVLSWALAFPNVAAQFEQFGTKGGSLPGVVTAAYFAVELESPPIILTVFYRGLPLLDFAAWIGDFRMQAVEFDALTSACAVLAEALPN